MSRVHERRRTGCRKKEQEQKKQRKTALHFSQADTLTGLVLANQQKGGREEPEMIATDLFCRAQCIPERIS